MSTEYASKINGKKILAERAAYTEDGTNLDTKFTSIDSTLNGLGTASTKDVPTTGNATSTQVVMGNDSRLSDSRTPTSHASSETTYGVGTTSNYGHVKLATGDMNGASDVDGVAVSKSHTHSQYESAANKKQSIDDTSTTEFPSSKAVAEFVNSSVATNTANFLGTKDVVTDLGLTTSATNSQIATALGSYTWPSGVTPTNNDYVFVSINLSTTTDVDEYRRFKYTASTTSWEYEFTLNNSSFTQAQWDAINSGMTATDKTSYSNHVADTDIHVTTSDKSAWNAKADKVGSPTNGNLMGMDATGNPTNSGIGVPVNADATDSQVVLGSDSRLTEILNMTDYFTYTQNSWICTVVPPLIELILNENKNVILRADSHLYYYTHHFDDGGKDKFFFSCVAPRLPNPYAANNVNSNIELEIEFQEGTQSTTTDVIVRVNNYYSSSYYHTHGNISTTGTAIDPTDAANLSNFLRADGTWIEPPVSGVSTTKKAWSGGGTTVAGYYIGETVELSSGVYSLVGGHLTLTNTYSNNPSDTNNAGMHTGSFILWARNESGTITATMRMYSDNPRATNSDIALFYTIEYTSGTGSSRKGKVKFMVGFGPIAATGTLTTKKTLGVGVTYDFWQNFTVPSSLTVIPVGTAYDSCLTIFKHPYISQTVNGVGSSTQPVYVNSSGQVDLCDFKICHMSNSTSGYFKIKLDKTIDNNHSSITFLSAGQNSYPCIYQVGFQWVSGSFTSCRLAMYGCNNYVNATYVPAVTYGTDSDGNGWIYVKPSVTQRVTMIFSVSDITGILSVSTSTTATEVASPSTATNLFSTVLVEGIGVQVGELYRPTYVQNGGKIKQCNGRTTATVEITGSSTSTTLTLNTDSRTKDLPTGVLLAVCNASAGTVTVKDGSDTLTTINRLKCKLFVQSNGWYPVQST